MTYRKVLTTGGFDPIHSGHISLLEEAKECGDELVVGLNSDEWLTRKKGQPFLSFDERKRILEKIEPVDRVVSFDDSDGTACECIEKLLSENSEHLIVFANGGDRSNYTTPEYKLFQNHSRIIFSFETGGNTKKNSSSWILDNWEKPKTFRKWGWYRVLDDQPQKGFKIKELVMEPVKSMSNQRHEKRNEHWFVLDGTVEVTTEWGKHRETVYLQPMTKGYDIGAGVWHKPKNPTNQNVHILEVQYGEECIEEDIERRDQS